METILMNAENSKTNATKSFCKLIAEFILKMFQQTCSSSKRIYLLSKEKYKTTAPKQ